MIKDFSIEAQASTIGEMSRISELSEPGSLTRSTLMDHSSWVDRLGIGGYISATTAFNVGILTENEFAKGKMTRIFNDVQSADTVYGDRLEKSRTVLKEVSDFARELSDSFSSGSVIVNPFVLYFHAGRVTNAFNDFMADRWQNHYFHFSNGRWEVDTEMLRKDLESKFHDFPFTDLLDLTGALSMLKPSIRVTETDDKIVTSGSLIEQKIQNTLLQLFGAEESFRKTLFGKNTVASYLLQLTNGAEITKYLTRVKTTSSELNTEYDFEFPKQWEDALEKNHPKLRKDLLPNEEPRYFDTKTGKKIDEKDAPTFYERQFSLLEYKNGVKAEKSLFEYTNEDLLGGKLDVKVGNAEAHADFAAGLYVLNNKGEKVFSPGVSAEVGVSATAFNAKYENQLLGNEMLGVNVDAEVTLLSASAKAGAEINFLGKDAKGNVTFDPQVNVHAGAEAIAAKVEGSAGLNILGGEVGVKGSVQFGIGAKADFGIKDGVVKCEIGATLGLGFEVGFEVDVGGMVDSACSWFKNTFGW